MKVSSIPIFVRAKIQFLLSIGYPLEEKRLWEWDRLRIRKKKWSMCMIVNKSYTKIDEQK